MYDFEKMKEIVAGGLSDYLKCPVIQSNQNHKPPAYPYCSYTMTTPMSANNGTYAKYDDGIDRKPFTQTWSVTVQSSDEAESVALANKAHDWLERIGHTYLSDNNVTVQSVGGITNRDNILTVEYEYRNGFDVVFWALNEVENPIEETEYIETVGINGGLIEPEPTTEELIERLEKRLDGEI